MAADLSTDGPGTPIMDKGTTNFNHIVYNYDAVPIFLRVDTRPCPIICCFVVTPEGVITMVATEGLEKARA